MENCFFVVSPEDAGVRLDAYLTTALNFSRSRVKKLCDEELVTVRERVEKAGYSVRAGDAIRVTVPDVTVCSAAPEDLPVDIVYEDDYIAVINKAQGMVTHPAPTTPSGTLVNALMFRLDSLSSINGVLRPGIVHRLDKDTSGLLVVAKTDAAHVSLSEQIAAKTARRTYRAIVDGNITSDSGVIDAPIGRSRSDRKKMAVVDTGRRAVTHFTVLARYGKYTYVEYELETGRTHQIRVHSKYVNHPVIGDETYNGSNEFGLKGQLLHAYKLEFDHPITGERMTFSAPLPDYFEAVLKKLEPLKR